MKTTKNSIRSKLKIKPEMYIAFLAIIISMSTLVVYIYQSNLMKQQQKMSVWPYISFGPSWGEDYLIISLINKGIGPAIINDVKIEFDNNALHSIQEIVNFIPDSIRTDFMYSSIWPGQVIMAGESINVIKITEGKLARFLLKELMEGKFSLEVCYSSVYGDTWKSYGLNVEESKCGK